MLGNGIAGWGGEGAAGARLTWLFDQAGRERPCRRGGRGPMAVCRCETLCSPRHKTPLRPFRAPRRLPRHGHHLRLALMP